MASSSLCRRRHQLNEIMRKNIGVVVVGVSVFVVVLWVDVAVLFTRRQHYIASSSSTSSLLFSLLFPRCCCHHRCQWRYLRRRRRQRRLRSGMECEYLGSAKYLWATIVLWLSRDVFVSRTTSPRSTLAACQWHFKVSCLQSPREFFFLLFLSLPGMRPAAKVKKMLSLVFWSKAFSLIWWALFFVLLFVRKKAVVKATNNVHWYPGSVAWVALEKYVAFFRGQRCIVSLCFF